MLGLAGLLLSVLAWWMLTRFADTERAPVRSEGEVGLPASDVPALAGSGDEPWSGEERLVAAVGLVLSSATGEPVPGARAFVTVLGEEWEVSLDSRGAFSLQVPTERRMGRAAGSPINPIEVRAVVVTSSRS